MCRPERIFQQNPVRTPLIIRLFVDRPNWLDTDFNRARSHAMMKR